MCQNVLVCLSVSLGSLESAVYISFSSHPESYNMVLFLSRMSCLLAKLFSRGLSSEWLPPGEETSLNKQLCRNSLMIVSHTLFQYTYRNNFLVHLSIVVIVIICSWSPTLSKLLSYLTISSVI